MAASNGDIVMALGTNNYGGTLTQTAGLASKGRPSLEHDRRPTPGEGAHSNRQHPPGHSPASDEAFCAVADPRLTLT
eukprot:926046-Alexandrium_andersonii.AAC.1